MLIKQFVYEILLVTKFSEVVSYNNCTKMQYSNKFILRVFVPTVTYLQTARDL